MLRSSQKEDLSFVGEILFFMKQLMRVLLVLVRSVRPVFEQQASRPSV